MKRCKTCRQVLLRAGAQHTCPPAWRVWCPDWGEGEEDALTVYAHGAEHAAWAWAKKADGEGDLAGHSTLVRVAGEGGEQVVSVEGVVEVAYRVKEVEG